MHGVGKEWVRIAFEKFNINKYIAVEQQIEAHPDFPTVPFPNPEEGKGALVCIFFYYFYFIFYYYFYFYLIIYY